VAAIVFLLQCHGLGAPVHCTDYPFPITSRIMRGSPSDSKPYDTRDSRLSFSATRSASRAGSSTTAHRSTDTWRSWRGGSLWRSASIKSKRETPSLNCTSMNGLVALLDSSRQWGLFLALAARAALHVGNWDSRKCSLLVELGLFCGVPK